MNVGKSINCIVAMVDRLQQQEEQLQTVMSAEPQEGTGDTNSQNTGDGKSRFRLLLQTSACFCYCLCIKSFLYTLCFNIFEKILNLALN